MKYFLILGFYLGLFSGECQLLLVSYYKPNMDLVDGVVSSNHNVQV